MSNEEIELLRALIVFRFGLNHNVEPLIGDLIAHGVRMEIKT